jgi:putative peptidoglycan lipid II flippase
MSSDSVTVQPLSVNRRIFSAVSAVTLAALVVKLAATMKEFTVAGIFGRGDALEAFLIAALVPGLLINLISESMNQALIPTLVQVRTVEGRERAQQLLSNALVCTCVLLLLASMGMALAARFFFPLTGSHFAAAKLNLTIHLFYGLLPVVVLTGVASLFTAVLNTTGTFASPALAPIVTPLAIMLAAPLLANRFGIWAIVYGTVIGALLHAMWTGLMMNASEYRLVLRWYGMCEATREVGRQYCPLFLSGLVASGGLIVDQSMAAMLPAGSVSALAYAGRFVSVALALLGGAFSSAVTPFFSELVARGDWNRCRQTLRTWAWWSAGVAASVTCVLIMGARGLVRVTFQHGAFGPQDTSAVSSVLIIYALQIPFFVCSRVYYRFLVTMRRTDVVFYCGFLNLGLDIVLNLLLMPRFGVAGIALSTSLWSASTLIFLGYWSLRILPKDRADIPNRED